VSTRVYEIKRSPLIYNFPLRKQIRIITGSIKRVKIVFIFALLEGCRLK
jgi:hypothetical protein